MFLEDDLKIKVAYRENPRTFVAGEHIECGGIVFEERKL